MTQNPEYDKKNEPEGDKYGRRSPAGSARANRRIQLL